MSQNIPPEPTPSLPRKHNSIEMSWDSQVSDPKVNVDSTNPIQARSNNVPFLNLKNPIVIRGEAVQKSLELETFPAELYAKLAITAKRAGGALCTTIENLSTIPLRDIPILIAPLNAHSMPSIDAIRSADAIELQLGDWPHKVGHAGTTTSLGSLQVQWPVDTPDLLRLAKKIELMRCLAQSSIPIGIAVPFCDALESTVLKFQWLSEVGIDFVTIRSASSCLGSSHPAQKYFSCDPIELARRIKTLLHRPGKNPIAIAIDYPWNDGYQAAQAMIAGASLVCVDGYLAKSISTVAKLMNTYAEDTLSASVLRQSSILSASSLTVSLTQIIEKLDLNTALSLFIDQLRSSLEFSL